MTVSSVLFIGMGLSGEIQRILGFSWRILNCPKCLTFWCVLAVLLIGRNPVLHAVAVSFFCSYAAMWLTLALDAAAVKYNYIYGKITENTGTEKGTEAPDASSGEDGLETGAFDEVPQMQIR